MTRLQNTAILGYNLVQTITAPSLSISTPPIILDRTVQKMASEALSGECYQYLVPRWDKIESPWDLRCLAILEVEDH